MFAQTLSPRVGLLALAAAGTLLAAATASAADTAREAYQAQRAACEAGTTGQDRATCLREAGAALEEARRGRLTRGVSDAQLRENAAQRCERLPANQRSDCMALRSGDVQVSGSVKGGGILRSTTIRQVGEPTSSSSPTMQHAVPVPAAPAPSGGTGLR